MSSNNQSDAIGYLQYRLNLLTDQIEQTKILAAQPMVRELRRLEDAIPLCQSEFRVFSQFGDDGIIQYSINRLHLPIAERRFIEFGVENYYEANTRFLLLNDNWSGLIMDGSDAYISDVRRESLYWRHDLTALARFIRRENINPILEEAGFSGRIGILSIDVDGNDYWIWEALTAVDPAIVIVEYNGIFGSHEAVTIPYQPDFARQNAHYSYLYWEPLFRRSLILPPEKVMSGLGAIAREITPILCGASTLTISTCQGCRKTSSRPSSGKDVTRKASWLTSAKKKDLN
jgi:hypothetical protein